MDGREQAVVPPHIPTPEALMEPPRSTPGGPQLQPVLQSDPQETPKKAKPPKQTAINSYLHQPGAKTGGADASSSAGSTDGAKQAGASSTIPISTSTTSTATAAAVATSAQAEATATSTVSPNPSLPSADAEVGMEVTGSDDESTLRDEAILSMAAAKVEKEHTPKKKMKVIDKRRALENELHIKIKEVLLKLGLLYGNNLIFDESVVGPHRRRCGYLTWQEATLDELNSLLQTIRTRPTSCTIALPRMLKIDTLLEEAKNFRPVARGCDTKAATPVYSRFPMSKFNPAKEAPPITPATGGPTTGGKRPRSELASSGDTPKETKKGKLNATMTRLSEVEMPLQLEDFQSAAAYKGYCRQTYLNLKHGATEEQAVESSMFDPLGLRLTSDGLEKWCRLHGRTEPFTVEEVKKAVEKATGARQRKMDKPPHPRPASGQATKVATSKAPQDGSGNRSQKSGGQRTEVKPRQQQQQQQQQQLPAAKEAAANKTSGSATASQALKPTTKKAPTGKRITLLVRPEEPGRARITKEHWKDVEAGLYRLKINKKHLDFHGTEARHCGGYLVHVGDQVTVAAVKEWFRTEKVTGLRYFIKDREPMYSVNYQLQYHMEEPAHEIVHSTVELHDIKGKFHIRDTRTISTIKDKPYRIIRLSVDGDWMRSLLSIHRTAREKGADWVRLSAFLSSLTCWFEMGKAKELSAHAMSPSPVPSPEQEDSADAEVNMDVAAPEGDEEGEGDGSGEEEESMQVGPHDVNEDGGPTEAAQSPEDGLPAWTA